MRVSWQPSVRSGVELAIVSSVGEAVVELSGSTSRCGWGTGLFEARSAVLSCGGPQFSAGLARIGYGD
jgi:hypothetical protein